MVGSNHNSWHLSTNTVFFLSNREGGSLGSGSGRIFYRQWWLLVGNVFISRDKHGQWSHNSDHIVFTFQ